MTQSLPLPYWSPEKSYLTSSCTATLIYIAARFRVKYGRKVTRTTYRTASFDWPPYYTAGSVDLPRYYASAASQASDSTILAKLNRIRRKFRIWIRGLGRFVWRKKRSKILCYCLFKLKCYFTIFLFPSSHFFSFPFCHLSIISSFYTPSLILSFLRLSFSPSSSHSYSSISSSTSHNVPKSISYAADVWFRKFSVAASLIN
jgi:hypothetical protein